MADFMQAGSITTIHALKPDHWQRLDGELRRWRRRKPLGLVLPALYSEFESPAIYQILSELEKVDWIERLVLVLSQADEEQHDQVCRLFARFGERAKVLWRESEPVQAMLAEGKIKRIGAVPNHYALGITANGMAVWDVPDERVSEIGRRLGAMPQVSHCYRRPRHPPSWPYNLFAMVHGYSRDEVLGTIHRLGRELGIDGYPHAVLFSTRLLKKRGARLRTGAPTLASE